MGVVAHICFTYFISKHTIKTYGCGGPYLLHIFYGQTYHKESWVWWPIFASHILQPVKHTIKSLGCGGPYLLHICYSQSNIPYRVMGVVAHICFTYFTASQTYHTELWVWWPIFASHILWPVKHTIKSQGCGGPYLLHIFYSQSNITYRVMDVVAHICFTYFTASQTYHTELWVWWCGQTYDHPILK